MGFNQEGQQVISITGAISSLGGDVSVDGELDAGSTAGSLLKSVDVPDLSAYTLLAKDSGLIHMVPNLSQDIIITTPAAAYGLHYEFWYIGEANDVSDWEINTGANVNFFQGGVVFADDNAGSAGDEIVPVYADGNSNSRLSVFRPSVGTVVKLNCGGLHWRINGTVVGPTSPAFFDQ